MPVAPAAKLDVPTVPHGPATPCDLPPAFMPQDHKQFLEALSSHLASLGQAVAQRCGAGVFAATNISTFQAHFEDSFKRLLMLQAGGFNDRLHDPRIGSNASVWQSDLMQKAAVDCCSPANWTQRDNSNVERGNRPSAQTHHTPRSLIPPTPALGKPLAPCTLRVPLPDGSRYEAFRPTVEYPAGQETSHGHGNGHGHTDVIRHEAFRPTVEQPIGHETTTSVSVGHETTLSISHYGTSGSAMDYCPSRFSTLTNVKTEVLQQIFRKLDVKSSGLLSPSLVHREVCQSGALRQAFTVEDTSNALIAINKLAAAASCDSSIDMTVGDGIGLNYAAFSWLLTTKHLTKRVVYSGCVFNEDHILAILLTFKKLYKHICDEESLKNLSEEHEEMQHRERQQAVKVGETVLDLQEHERKWRVSAGYPDDIVRSDSFFRNGTMQTLQNAIKDRRLDLAVSAVVIFWALVIGVSVDIQPEFLLWDMLEYLVKVFFLWEAFYKLRLYGFGGYFCGVDRAWNVFDFILVLFSICELALIFLASLTRQRVSHKGSNLLMFIRLTRLGRIIRLLRFPMFSELRRMIEGLFSGLRVLFWAFVLFLACVYVLAIILNSSVDNSNRQIPELEDFKSMYWSIFTVFRCFTDDCVSNSGKPISVHVVKNLGAGFYIGYIVSYLLVSLGLLNLIMAVYVDTAHETAYRRRQNTLASERMQQDRYVRNFLAKQVAEDEQSVHSEQTERIHPEQTECHNATEASSVSFGTRAFLQVMKLISWLRGVKAYQDPFYDFREYCEFGVRRKLGKMFDANEQITRDVFLHWFERSDDMQILLNELDIDCNAPLQLFDVMDADMSGFLDLREIIDGFMSLRGPIQKCDIVATLLSTRAIQKQLWEMHEEIRQLS